MEKQQGKPIKRQPRLQGKRNNRENLLRDSQGCKAIKLFSPMDDSPLPFIFSLLLLLLSPAISDANLHRQKVTVLELETQLSSQPSEATTFFQVTRPIPVPKTQPCSALLLRHDFGDTYGKPPVTVPYSPPAHCPGLRLGAPTNAVLRWSATCRGRQFDRIFGVWLGGVELLRSCTAEPRATGVVWTVEKDVTRYASLLTRNDTLAVYLGNLVDKTYTGIYHVNVTLDLYFAAERRRRRTHLLPGFDSPADLILPISRSLPLNDGLWFLIENSTDIQSKELVVPSNTYRAVLEVYVSFHSDDEFWYTNPPNIYISSNNLTGVPGNGPFREVTATLDGYVVGAVWPFTVIYTGGINPLLWRPITGIGSFDLPTYNIEITPFLGKILDGKPHTFGFGVTDALDVWFVDANLHLWLDSKSSHTSGELIRYEAPGFKTHLSSKFKGLDGLFQTTASRHIASTGWVKSSYGKITTNCSQNFEYKNWMEYSGNGSIQVINQTIDSNYGIYTKLPASGLYSEQVFQNFPLYLYTGTSEKVKDAYSFISNISFAFNEKKFAGEQFGFSVSSLRNLQTGQGTMRVKQNLVIGGVASTQQMYRYESTGGCYFRNVSSSNYTILHDESGLSCTEVSPLSLGFFSTKWLPFPVRRVSLSTEPHKANNGGLH